MPGSPFATDNISPSVLATLEANYGLDKPIDQQFVIYLQSLLQGNLGVSYTRTGVTVNDLIAQGFPVTLKLGLISFAIALVIGTVIGIWMSTTKVERRQGLADHRFHAVHQHPGLCAGHCAAHGVRPGPQSAPRSV